MRLAIGLTQAVAREVELLPSRRDALGSRPARALDRTSLQDGERRRMRPTLDLEVRPGPEAGPENRTEST